MLFELPNAFIFAFIPPPLPNAQRMKSGRSHNTGHKHRQRVNRLGRSTGVKGKKIEKNVRKLIGAL